MADSDLVGQYYLANALRQGQRQSPRSMLAQRMMQNALDTSPTTPLGALARALTGVVSAYTMRQAEEGDRLDQKQALSALMERDQQQQDEASQFQARLFGGGQPQQPAGAGTPAPAPVMRQALPDIGAPGQGGTRQNPAEPGAFSPVAMRTLVGQESGGDPNARPIDRQSGRPRSSALGQAQFIAPTWLAFAGANPNLFQGLDLNTPAGRDAALARRSDPTLTEPAVQWYAGQNASELRRAGLPVTDATLAAAHALGPAGAIGVLRAAPDTPLSRVLSPAAIQANPQYGQMTTGQFVADYGARYAPRADGVQVAGPGAPPAAATPAQTSAAPPVNMDALREGLASANPRIRRAAEAQLQALQLQRQQDVAARQADAAARQAQAAERQAAAAGRGPIPRGMQINPQTGQLEDIPGMPREPFAGDSIDAQASNVLLRIGPRIANGTATDEERQQYALAHSHLTAPSLQQVPADPNDPSRGMALAMVPRRAPEGFPAPDFRPQAPGASGVPGASLPQQQGSPGAGNPPATQGAGPGSQGSPAPGAPQIIPGTERPGATTDTERVAAGYAARMLASEQLLAQAQARGFRPGNLPDAIASRIPGIGNYLTSEQGQLYRQAQEDWVRAKLRRESGAVIGEEEMAQEIRTYFPQPGDTPAMIAQKTQARELAAQAMVQSSGRAPVIRPPSPGTPPAAGAVTHRFNPATGQVEAVH